VITSRDNRHVKVARSLRRRKGRHAESAYLVEGLRATLDTLQAGARTRHVFVSEEMLSAERSAQVRSAAEAAGAEVLEVSASVLASLAQSESPQGVVAVVEKPKVRLGDVRLRETALVLIGHEVRDPGNLGTMIRTAHAAGCDAVVLTGDSVDPYNEKCVRASMASLAQLPVVEDVGLQEACEWARAAGARVVATTPWARQTCFGVDLTGSTAFVVGGEARGLGDLARLGDEAVAIPMPGGAESLNVAVATGILLFEAVRQRHFRNATPGGEG
jgi:TrmH family RNA methyltransferase